MRNTKWFAVLCCLALAALLAAQRVSAGEPGTGPSPRPDPVRAAELHETVALTTGVREDDHPALCSRGSRLWVTWVSYSETEGTDRIFLREYDGARWGEPEEVSDGPGDYYKPAVAVDAEGSVWVAWPAQVRGNWDLYARERRGGRWGRVERLTADPGPDLEPQLAADRDAVWLVWQSLRKGNSGIFYRVLRQRVWGPEGAVTEQAGNNWAPTLAIDSEGGVHVAWDTYRAGNYDVYLRSFRTGAWGEETPVAVSPQLEARPALHADRQGRVWIAWEVGPENWAGDSAEGGLRARRSIGLACWNQGRLHRLPEAAAKLDDLWAERGAEDPAPVVSAGGRLWLFFRAPINANLLQVGVTSWQGGEWATPKYLIHSEGRIDQRIAMALDERGNVVACYPAGSRHNLVYFRRFENGRAGGDVPALGPAETSTRPAAPRPAPARHQMRGYQLVWGDLHRHTDISEDGGIRDGSLTDAMRYALDAAGLDFLGITDHTRYLPRRYNLWRIQKVTDLFYAPGFFAPLHAYERSQFSPWGHRNVVHLTRDYVPVPASYESGDPGVDPNGLFAALRGKSAITIPHTSAWANKQVSWDYYDPDIERLVEIYQGLRSTYEYAGAPDPAGRAVYEKDSPNFVWNALERNLKMGFIASSDHRSTHMSFAAVYAKGIDRASIFEALRARRTYAATDKIELDFSIDGHFMGEEISVAGPPVLQVAIRGTAPVEKIDVIKNNQFVYNLEPRQRDVRFEFRDQAWKGENGYYYIRLIQADRNMAWSSPIWVRKAPR